jgi:hypothetical protein
MNEHLSFHYGEGMVKVDVRGANLLTLPDIRSGRRVADVSSTVIAALAAPLGTAPLKLGDWRRLSY